MTLEGVKGPAVLTKVRTVAIADAVSDAAVATCMGQETDGAGDAEIAVQRTGVTGESVTFVDAEHRYLFACDNTAGQREGNRRWCGSSAGQFRGGRLRDPRLDVLCSGEDGRPTGFLWVQPSAMASYVVVEQRGYSEVYEPAGGLPIRVATASGMSDLPLEATIAVSEHESQGRLLRRYRLTAGPAG